MCIKFLVVLQKKINLFSIKMAMKKIFTIIIVIPTVITFVIKKCGGCKYRTKPNQT